MSESGKAIADSSMVEELYHFKALNKHYLCSEESCDKCQCKYCGTPLRAVMITPSFVKDYRNTFSESGMRPSGSYANQLTSIFWL